MSRLPLTNYRFFEQCDGFDVKFIGLQPGPYTVEWYLGWHATIGILSTFLSSTQHALHLVSNIALFYMTFR
jgi:hypothetical protein